MYQSRIYIGVILIAFSLSSAKAQFLGGNGDGYGMDDISSPLNEQAFYCSGGDGDGYDYDLFSSSFFDQTFYCSGGDGDGFDYDLINTAIFDQSFYCSGGDGDGFDYDLINTAIFDQTFYCSGGDGDGFDYDLINTAIFDQFFYCSGGDGDGFDYDLINTAIFDQSFYCSGGDGDGYDYDLINTPIFDQAFYCFGGDGDGYTMDSIVGTIFLGTGVWTGLTNAVWSTATNWKHNIVPDIDIDVTIPSGCPNYPVVSQTIGVDTVKGAIQCNALNLLNGSTFEHSDALYINGNMSVAGSYTATINGINSHQICKHGKLSIPATGNMIIGNQTTDPAMADMVIYDGGEVSIDGGTLTIDDKLWLQAGGSLAMTAGELFVHKYGIGSAMMSLNPGFFYVEAGALGGISGGNFRICGYDNDGFPRIPPYSMVINEPGFDFTGTSTIYVQHGDNAGHHNTGISVVDGVRFQNMVINKAFRSVFIRGNLAIDGALTLEANSNLEIEPGYTVTVGP